MKIRPVGAELFHPDVQTDITKLIVNFRNFANFLEYDCQSNSDGNCLECNDQAILSDALERWRLTLMYSFTASAWSD